MIDTHCHLTDKKFEGVIEKTINEAEECGVERIIVPSVNIADSEAAIKIANRYRNIYAAVGIHPEEVINGSVDIEKEIIKLRELCTRSDNVVAIGEIGLDFYWDKERKTVKEQVATLRAQMLLAKALEKPVVIHMRDAETEMWSIIEELEGVCGQFHCWAGSIEMLDFVIKCGYYVSFCGNITYKNSDKLRLALKKVPIERLLLETDSPYLPPEGLRKELNKPKNVKILAGYIASILGVTEQTLIYQTNKNAECLFFAG